MKAIRILLFVSFGILITVNQGCDKGTNTQDGSTRWTQTYGGSDRDGGYSVQQTLDGGYIITGHTDSFGVGGFDVYLLKTDANGNLYQEEDL